MSDVGPLERAASPKRLPRFVTRLAAPLPAALLAMVLCLPALVAGRQIDDYFHQGILEGEVLGIPASPWELFTFLDGDPVRTHALMDVGLVPWWTLPELRVAFFRPLSVMTHRLDHALWPGSDALAHLQSIVWYGLLVLAAGLLYRRLLGVPAAAGLAVLLYAVDDAHGVPVGWLANRNALVATTLGVLAIAAHDAAARAGWKPGLLLGPLLLGAALLGAEAGIAALAYIAAHALFLDRRPPIARLVALAPHALVLLIWSAVYRRLGYGAWGSGLYLDPATEPGPYLAGAAVHVPVLLLGQLGMPPADVATLLAGRAELIYVALAASLLALVTLVLLPHLREHAPARLFAAGMVLAALPVAATFPSDRLLLFVGLGGSGLVASFLQAWWDGASTVAPTRGARALALAWIAIHGVLAPILLPLRTLTFAAMGQVVERPVRAVDPGAATDVVLVNPPTDFIPGYVPVLRGAWGLPVPAHTRCLALGVRPVRIERTAGDTLLLTQEGGLLKTPLETLMRGPAHPMAAGARVELGGMTATVLEVTADGRPLRVSFRFAGPLEDGTVAWYVTRGWTLERWQPPAVGNAVELPGFP